MLGQGERRNKTKVLGSRKERPKDVSAINKSTYIRVTEVRESKMPGGSPNRSLPSKALNTKRDEIDQIVRVGSISCLIAYPH